MSTFEAYLSLGFHHIFNLEAYDHMVFLLALCAGYSLRDWKKVVALVTSFTIGHSITLALATFNVVKVNMALIELLIPVTILFTCAVNLFRLKGSATQKQVVWALPNLLALLFGLIHGLGFSNYLRSLLGKSASIATELFAFNLGIELGQLLIVAIVLALSWLVVAVLNAKRRDWVLVLSGMAGGIALVLLLGQL